MKLKRTPWFNGYTKPVRVGVYERLNIQGTLYYYYWDGRFWYSSWSDYGKSKSLWQKLQWRGITKSAAQNGNK